MSIVHALADSFIHSVHDLRIYSEPDAVPRPDDLKLIHWNPYLERHPQYDGKISTLVVFGWRWTICPHSISSMSDFLRDAGGCGCESTPLLGCGADPSSSARLFLSPKVKNTAQSGTCL